MLGVNSEQKESMQHYISDSIYGLTLAWITSENSTKQLECRHLLTRSSSLDPIFSATVSPLRCPVSTAPVRGSTPTLSAPFSNQLSSRVPLPLPATLRFQVQKPFVWFRAKTDKGIVCLAGHLYSVTLRATYAGICCYKIKHNSDVTASYINWPNYGLNVKTNIERW